MMKPWPRPGWLIAGFLVLVSACSSGGDSPVAPAEPTANGSPTPRAIPEAPLPFASVLNDMWASPSGAVFAVGNDGAAAVLRNGSWTRLRTGVKHNLRAVWGTGDDDVLAVGAGGCILHFDGQRWSPVFSGIVATLVGIAGAPGEPVFAVGDHVLMRSDDDGRTWSRVNVSLPSNEFIRSVAVSAQHGVYVGTSRRLLEFTADTLQVVGNSSLIFDIWIDEATGNLYLATSNGVTRFDGSSMVSLPGVTRPVSIDGIDIANAFVVGGIVDIEAARLTASGLVDIARGAPTTRSLRACAVTPDGALVVSDGLFATATFGVGGWTKIDGDDEFSFSGIFGVGDEVFAVSFRRGDPFHRFLHRYRGGQWLAPIDLADVGQAVWARSTTDVFVVGNGIVHFDGVAPQPVQLAGTRFNSVFGNHDVVYAGGGDAGLWRFDGNTWSDVSDLLRPHVTRVSVQSLWVAPAGEVFVGVEGGGLFVIEGDSARSIETPGGPLTSAHAIFGFGPDDVYFVDTGLYDVWHWDGKKARIVLRADNLYRSVWGPAPDNVMVAGGDAIYHFNGNGWSSVHVGPGVEHIGGSSTDMFALGNRGSRIRIVQ